MRNQMPEFAPDHHNPASESAFKANFLESLRLFADDAIALRDVVNRLFDYGIPRKTLVEWGVEAGHRRSSMRNLISALLLSRGLRSRKPGAGRKVSPQALALLAIARRDYGDCASKFLLAAYRAGKAEIGRQRLPANTVTVLPSAATARFLLSPFLLALGSSAAIQNAPPVPS